MEASALLVRCDAHAMQTLLSLAAGCANYLQFYSYRRARPQVVYHHSTSFIAATTHCVAFTNLALAYDRKTG